MLTSNKVKYNIFLERVDSFYKNKIEYISREIKYLRENIFLKREGW